MNSDRLRLWTIQSIPAWEKLQKLKVLQADRHYIEKEFLNAYQWMALQMKKKLGYRPFRDSVPLWAWYQWEGKEKRKPDLRYSGHLPKGVKGVLIEFKIDRNQALLSDFDLWHYVLNYWYLPISKKDHCAFLAELSKEGLSFYETKPLPNIKYHKRIVKGWGRIFDIDSSNDYIASPNEEKSIQACFWELRIENVRNIQIFISK